MRICGFKHSPVEKIKKGLILGGVLWPLWPEIPFMSLRGKVWLQNGFIALVKVRLMAVQI
jgi:hypothetical protein